MKVLCLNVTNKISKDDVKIRERNIKLLNDDIVFKEMLIPLDFLNKRVFVCNKGFIGKLKGKHLDAKIKKVLKSETGNEKLYLCTNLLKLNPKESKASGAQVKQYIDNIMQECKFGEFNYNGNILANIDKYIEELLNKRNKSSHEAKILLVYKELFNIDFIVVKELVTKYKEVDIYSKTNFDCETIKKIENINKELGTTITLKDKRIKQNRKIDYDIVIYLDDYRKNFNELRLMSRVSSIELCNNDNDKFDDKVVSLKKNKLYTKINKENLHYLEKNYGRLKVSAILCKIIRDT
ncbi:MAG: hypothetical protein IKV94_01605 [Clostridia bacterium]|nr:hypothetical protein [Clostridia bacterium]